MQAILCALVLRSQVHSEASNAYYPSRGRNSSDLGSYRVRQTTWREVWLGSRAGLPRTDELSLSENLRLEYTACAALC